MGKPIMKRNDSTKIRFPVLDGTGKPIDLGLVIDATYQIRTQSGRLLFEGRLHEAIAIDNDYMVASITPIDYSGTSTSHQCRLWMADGSTFTAVKKEIFFEQTFIKPIN